MSEDSWIKGKTCMITGANTGIGKETTRQLAALGSRVIMVCRNQEKGAYAKAEIIQTTDNENIELLICDLASLKDVKRFTDEFLQTHANLHVLINNAGVFHMKRTTTCDGYESTFAVNYLAHYYLTELLLPLLKRSSPSRIINLSSNIHRSFKIKMKDPLLEKGYMGQQAYSNSKTAMVLFTNKLVRELEGTKVTVNSVNPGHVETQMTTVGLSKWFRKIADLIPTRTIEQSAETSVYAASSNDLEGITGKYFTDCEESKTAKMTKNIHNQDFLWELSKRLVTEALAKQD
ncbi:MAG: SDR family oxidoreductase [Candidatus Heimdallarchaeota archaeon]|nr:SDR family oxidoreductase [Candidatus Heimdallarchaeota archaeon]MCG3254626.1 SDR family oxidoreductase [Candidatus Heimdallarchaeota archaeon]MCK4609708.1 SDR family oxidoreductase [Candidatus Heimdallarchaeota archaeon]